MIQAVFAVLLLVGSIVLFVRRNYTVALVEEPRGNLVSRGLWKIRKIDVAWLLGAGLLAVFVWGLRIIPPGSVGVRPGGTVVRGWYWTAWPLETPRVFPITRQTLLLPEKGEDGLWAPTRDGVSAGVRVVVWYVLDTARIRTIAARWTPENLKQALRSLVEGTVRSALGRYALRDLASTPRETLATAIQEHLQRALQGEGLQVERVILQDVMIPVAFQKAFEQEALARARLAREDLELERARKEAERARVEAEGKARAIEIVSRALKKNPEYLKYLYIEKLSDNVEVIVQDSRTFLNFPEKGPVRKGFHGGGD